MEMRIYSVKCPDGEYYPYKIRTDTKTYSDPNVQINANAKVRMDKVKLPSINQVLELVRGLGFTEG